MHFLLPFSLLFLFSLLQLPSSFPARPLPNNNPTVLNLIDNPSSVSLSSAFNSTPWRRFAKFANLEKGSHVAGICDLKSYFHHFGYLPAGNFSDDFDTDLESAILTYQKNLGLAVTGKLDSNTIDLIMAPRCGMGDSHTRAAPKNGTSLVHLHETRRYAYFNGRPRWIKSSPLTLTYAFSPDHMINYIALEEIRTVFSRAFERWSAVIPVNFTEVEDYKKADIHIGFYDGDHGDGEPFDGVLGVLAHAFSPENGRLHLDASETWAVDFRNQDSRVAIDLESVATHEIGHVLGLAHSSVSDAIMYPSLRPRSKKVDLRVDDVEGVQALYGSNPNFNYGSLLEADQETSNSAAGFGLSSWWLWTVLFISLGQVIYF